MSYRAAVELNEQAARLAELSGEPNPKVEAWRVRQASKPWSDRVYVHALGGWDPEWPVMLISRGICIGALQPVNYAAIARNPDLQPWSRGAQPA